jgi:antitoxin (DNA-binding transcriptional repressor) of toxin-antitoxin stability system
MHPTRYELEAYILENLRDPERVIYVRDHLQECEFCREMVTDFEEYLQELKAAEPVRITSINDLRIDLKPLAEENQRTPLFMAADGSSKKPSRSSSLGTFYSEKPELVLRVMSSESGSRYLQLMGDDPESYANVMVRLPELDYEFMTDSTGCADISGYDFGQVEKLSWQVKMPEAVMNS